MADEITISAVTGLTINIQAFSGSTPIGAPIAATEISTTGEYLASVPNGTPRGIYLLVAYVGTDEKIASGLLYWDGFAEVTPMMYDEIHENGGLDNNNPMTATPTSRTSTNINLVIAGYGTNETTVTRQ